MDGENGLNAYIYCIYIVRNWMLWNRVPNENIIHNDGHHFVVVVVSPAISSCLRAVINNDNDTGSEEDFFCHATATTRATTITVLL